MQERPDNAIIPADPRSDVVVYGPSSYAPFPPAPATQPNILHIIHASLRGRYPIVIVLALIATAAGGIAGYRLGYPMYESKALISVSARIPKLLYETEQPGMTPMFTSFVNTQAIKLQHDRVINRAVNSEEWRELGRTNLPEDVTRFRRSLNVKLSREAPELINVSFTDREARAAKVGLEQVLKAYQEIFGTGDKQVESFQLGELGNRQRNAQARIATLRNEIRSEAAEVGTDDLTQLHGMRLTRLIELERTISEIEMAIVEREPGEGSAAGVAAIPAEATPEQIAAVDRTMESLLADKRRFEAMIKSMTAQGVGESHPSLKEARTELKIRNDLIEDHARVWNATPRPAAEGAPIGVGESLEQLKSRRERMRAQAEAWRDELLKLYNKKEAIESKQREITEIQAELAAINRRIDEINERSKIEEAIGRIEIIPPENVPSAPTVDPRKKYAALGGGLGGAVVVGLAFLIGLIDRRCRYSDEVNQTVEGKLIACLPVMARSTDEEDALAAVHSLHRVRAQMQIIAADRRTIAITSANAGDGKTSLALSLGISFAGVGHRTLLIDLDIVGHGLSSRMRMCQGRGILDALNAGTPEGFARPTHVHNLFVLPVGDDVDASPASLRREEVQALLRAAAASYDTVLIDTGPLLGSLEANFVCSSADAVVLVIGRGQSRALVRRTIQHIHDIGATLLGVVFNRARDQDFRSSSVSASFRSVRNTTRPPAAGSGKAPDVSIDPLADAVFVDAQSYRDSHADDPDAAVPTAS